MGSFEEKLNTLLKTDKRFLDKEGELHKGNVIDAAYKADRILVELLLGEAEMKKKFFGEVKECLVFDINTFVAYIQDKNFLNDSYTRFKNKIGLNIDGKFLNERGEVALVWPFKDCVLEGGMTKEDEKRKEIFFNEILAQDEIDKLFAPKVLTNWKRYTAKGAEKIGAVKSPEDGMLKRNLLLQGNTLLALNTLKEKFQEKVKLIYIAPPYNTGNDSFGYNDSFNHSSWLTFMRNRLETAKQLLSKDVSIWINIDDDESHYLKVLCDGIFGRDNFVANVIWEKKYSPQNDAKWLSDSHDHILVYAKNKSAWRPYLLPRTEESNARYKNPDNDPRGLWKSGDISAKRVTEKDIYEIITPSGRSVLPPQGTSWRYSKEKFAELVKDNRIWFGPKGEGVPAIKRFLSEVQEGMVSKTIWFRTEVGDNQDSKREINELGFGSIFDTPKPERLLQRILELGSKKGDIVLDFFAGSGTTLAVAHKTGRQYIGIEQMDYIHDLPEARLKKVIAGEQGGISEAVGWKGGGDFVYMELAKWNEKIVKKVREAKTAKDLIKIWNELKDNTFLSWKVDLKIFDENVKDFADLSIADQKKFLIECLDKNQLYVNLSEIEDKEYGVSKEDIKLNKEFYD